MAILRPIDPSRDLSDLVAEAVEETDPARTSWVSALVISVTESRVKWMMLKWELTTVTVAYQ